LLLVTVDRAPDALGSPVTICGWIAWRRRPAPDRARNRRFRVQKRPSTVSWSPMPPEHDLQRLLDEEPFVRDLARQLVAGEADEVVQRTWLRAVQQGGAGVDKPATGSRASCATSSPTFGATTGAAPRANVPPQ